MLYVLVDILRSAIVCDHVALGGSARGTWQHYLDLPLSHMAQTDFRSLCFELTGPLAWLLWCVCVVLMTTDWRVTQSAGNQGNNGRDTCGHYRDYMDQSSEICIVLYFTLGGRTSVFWDAEDAFGA